MQNNSELVNLLAPNETTVALNIGQVSAFNELAGQQEMVWPYPEVSMVYSPWAFTLITIVLILLVLWTIVGNGLVFAALYQVPRLRTMSNFLIGNLALSDFLLALTILPLSLANDVTGYWLFGPHICNLWLSLDVLYCTASVWNLVVIAFDRFTATTFPVWYRGCRSKRRVTAYAVFVWLFAILICLPGLFGWGSARPPDAGLKHKNGTGRPTKQPNGSYRSTQDHISISKSINNNWVNKTPSNAKPFASGITGIIDSSTTKTHVFKEETGNYECVLYTEPPFVLYSAFGSFIIPLIIMLCLYAKIFHILRTRSRMLRERRKRHPLGLQSTIASVTGIEVTNVNNSRDEPHKKLPPILPHSTIQISIAKETTKISQTQTRIADKNEIDDNGLEAKPRSNVGHIANLLENNALSSMNNHEKRDSDVLKLADKSNIIPSFHAQMNEANTHPKTDASNLSNIAQGNGPQHSPVPIVPTDIDQCNEAAFLADKDVIPQTLQAKILIPTSIEKENKQTVDNIESTWNNSYTHQQNITSPLDCIDGKIVSGKRVLLTDNAEQDYTKLNNKDGATIMNNRHVSHGQHQHCLGLSEIIKGQHSVQADKCQNKPIQEIICDLQLDELREHKRTTFSGENGSMGKLNGNYNGCDEKDCVQHISLMNNVDSPDIAMVNNKESNLLANLNNNARVPPCKSNALIKLNSHNGTSNDSPEAKSDYEDVGVSEKDYNTELIGDGRCIEYLNDSNEREIHFSEMGLREKRETEIITTGCTREIRSPHLPLVASLCNPDALLHALPLMHDNFLHDRTELENECQIGKITQKESQIKLHTKLTEPILTTLQILDKKSLAAVYVKRKAQIQPKSPQIEEADEYNVDDEDLYDNQNYTVDHECDSANTQIQPSSSRSSSNASISTGHNTHDNLVYRNKIKELKTTQNTIATKITTFSNEPNSSSPCVEHHYSLNERICVTPIVNSSNAPMSFTTLCFKGQNLSEDCLNPLSNQNPDKTKERLRKLTKSSGKVEESKENKCDVGELFKLNIRCNSATSFHSAQACTFENPWVSFENKNKQHTTLGSYKDTKIKQQISLNPSWRNSCTTTANHRVDLPPRTSSNECQLEWKTQTGIASEHSRTILEKEQKICHAGDDVQLEEADPPRNSLINRCNGENEIFTNKMNVNSENFERYKSTTKYPTICEIKDFSSPIHCTHINSTARISHSGDCQNDSFLLNTYVRRKEVNNYDRMQPIKSNSPSEAASQSENSQVSGNSNIQFDASQPKCCAKMRDIGIFRNSSWTSCQAFHTDLQSNSLHPICCQQCVNSFLRDLLQSTTTRDHRPPSTYTTSQSHTISSNEQQQQYQPQIQKFLHGETAAERVADACNLNNATTDHRYTNVVAYEKNIKSSVTANSISSMANLLVVNTKGHCSEASTALRKQVVTTPKVLRKSANSLANTAAASGTKYINNNNNISCTDNLERRATKHMAVIILMFVLCWIPFTITYMLRSLCSSESCEDNLHWRSFATWLGYANSGLNPILYAVFNEEFRHAFASVLLSCSRVLRRGSWSKSASNRNGVSKQTRVLRKN